MRKMYLAITGIGNVGRRLLELIDLKRETLQKHFDLDLIVAGACDTTGGLINHSGIDPQKLKEAKKQNRGVSTLSGAISGMKPFELIHAVQAHVLVELTLTNLKDGEPGLSVIRKAISKGMHVVTANKGPLVLAYSELSNLAREKGVKLFHSATVTGGLPTLNIGTRDLSAAAIDRVEGVLNGTTNYILTRMTQGETYDNALKHAQDVGMAEADPSLDVDGWDAACKLVLIANAVLRQPTKLSDVSVEGITGVSMQQLRSATSNGQVMKLIALAEKNEKGFALSVKPTLLPGSHPLARIGSGMMAVQYHTDINGTIFASIEEPDPYPTAAAVLRDIVHVCGG